MEKRRRARINQCLDELKSLILEAMKKDVSFNFKKLTFSKTCCVDVINNICLLNLTHILYCHLVKNSFLILTGCGKKYLIKYTLSVREKT